MITKVQLPMSREALVLATNQGLLYVLSMVVIGGLVGGGSLGYIVVSGFSQDQLFGKGLAAGIAITALGVMLDRIAQHAAARLRPLTTHRRLRRIEPRSRRRDNDMARGLDRLAAGWSRRRRVCGLGSPLRRAATSRTPTARGRRQGLRRPSTSRSTRGPGYVANAHVIGYVAETKLGCKVTYKDVKEEVGWQGMASGTIDTIVENWGHPDLIRSTSTSRRPSRTPVRPATRASSAGTSRRGWPRSTPTSPTGRT